MLNNPNDFVKFTEAVSVALKVNLSRSKLVLWKNRKKKQQWSIEWHWILRSVSFKSNRWLNKEPYANKRSLRRSNRNAKDYLESAG
jgi:hypothetical protein